MCPAPANVSHVVALDGDRAGTHGNNNVNLQVGLFELLLGRFCEQISHCHSTPVDRDSVNGRVGSSKVDEFKDIGSKDSGLGDLATGDTVSGDNDCLSCNDISLVPVQA